MTLLTQAATAGSPNLHAPPAAPRRRGARQDPQMSRATLAASLMLAATVGCGGGSDPASGSESVVGSRSRPTSAADTDGERRMTARSGGGDDASAASTSAPAAPALRLAWVGKQLQLSWDAASGAAYYKLFANADGASGFTRVGSDLAADRTGAALEVAAHRHNWDRARYLLEACNSAGCTSSNPVTTFGLGPSAPTSAYAVRGRFAQPASAPAPAPAPAAVAATSATDRACVRCPAQDDGR